ncbi:MAG TPA: hypothetical protein EYG79_06540 [Rhodobacteraceae bacterium]|nr:hypothetical protein [Paracoccaceae bacterium]
MTSENHIEALLRAAKNSPSPQPSPDLISRVLADAAGLMPAPEAAPKPRFWARWFAPVGGMGGALTLAACASFGVFAGAGYADEMLAIPGLDGVLAGLTDFTDSTTPFESLSLLMTEG